MIVTRTMKIQYVISWFLLALGMIIDESALIIISFLTFVILSAQTEILEAIHKLGEGK